MTIFSSFLMLCCEHKRFIVSIFTDEKAKVLSIDVVFLVISFGQAKNATSPVSITSVEKLIDELINS